jgi:hypothetical protein
MSQGVKKKSESCWGVQDSVDTNPIKRREKYYKRFFSCVLYYKNGGLRKHLQIRIELAEIIIQEHHSTMGIQILDVPGLKLIPSG